MNKVYATILFCSVGIFYTWLIYDYSLDGENFVQEESFEEFESFYEAEANVEPVVETIDLEKRAYEIGFDRGKNALYQQMGRFDKIEDKQTEYTVLIEENEETKEIQLKGYVDGYHKASESLQCPRNF